MNRILVLVRHADRDRIAGPAGDDNGLNARGKVQAAEVARLLSERFSEHASSAVLLSSPKKRCRETLEPLAAKWKLKARVSPQLDEGGAIERKVKSWLKECEASGSPLVISCSHGDLIPVALEKLVGREIHLAKSGIAIVRLGEEGPELEDVIQGAD